MKSGRPIAGLSDVHAVTVAPDRAFHSATHEEIRRGLTSDIYFVKTMDVLRALDLASTPVAAEVFANGDGVLAGIEEACALLRDAPVAIEALPEGTPIRRKDIVMRIRGPYEAFGIYETALLGMLASSTGWATAAAEAKRAAGDKPVFSFGARHVHPAVAPVMERAALIGGADACSCILGAKLLGRTPQGTMPHALMLIAGDTVEVALAYDRWMPPEEARTILVDTFRDEAEESLRVADALGERLDAVRLDTPSELGGVTPELVQRVRRALDEHGYRHVKVIVSGGMTPERIRTLSAAGADGFGVGSYISGAPPVDMTMDIKEVAGRPVAKRGRKPGLTDAPRLRLVKDDCP